ncbi:MAG TPA: 2,3-bisphosphoglycerate-independent phosphoglycerate mutase [Patescibacteria group bacterium]|nr:2,3-bisphosphoglycerate-independent phosphoglycerate mutase [Patescibacteria group bacterium]
MPNKKIKPALLLILDGFGIASPSQGNAVSLAKKPVYDKLVRNFPTFTLQASGESVGLGWGEPGNSEVGHLNLGAGQIVWQKLPRINRAIRRGEFQKNKEFLKAIKHVKENDSSLHLMGLCSNGGIHSSVLHLYTLLEMAKKNDLKKVYIHVFLDGRDTAFNAGLKQIKEIIDKCQSLGLGEIATISGRSFAMDRDKNWGKIETTYLAMVKGISENEFEDPIKAVKSSYEKKIYDEEFVPTVITKKAKPKAKVSDKDGLIFFNFRGDRAKEITKSFIKKDFKGFPRKKVSNLFFVAMNEYEKGLPDKVAFPSVRVNNPIAKVISDKGLKQAHIAESEKYAHVTYFFNGGREAPFPLERRIVIPSPKVSSYAKKPKMSAEELLHQTLWAIDSNDYTFIVLNFANPDMVAHTGDLQATVKAIEYLDYALGEIAKMTLEKDWHFLITADHGNAEVLVDPITGEIDKKHNKSPVPFIIVNNDFKKAIPLDKMPELYNITPSGVLADVAPTILNLMNIKVPLEMVGASLI